MTRQPMDIRAFVYGIIAGIAILIGSFVLVSEMAGVKWLPVHRVLSEDITTQ